MALPKLYTLIEAAKELRFVSVATLRKEVRAGRLSAMRATPSINSPILLQEEHILQWIEEYAVKNNVNIVVDRQTDHG